MSRPERENDEPPLSGEWRHNNGYICCGTLRIAVQDFDTDPSEERKKLILDWMVAALNEKQQNQLAERRK